MIWTDRITDAHTSDRRAYLATLQARARRRLYFGPDGLAWAPVRFAAYVVIGASLGVIAGWLS